VSASESTARERATELISIYLHLFQTAKPWQASRDGFSTLRLICDKLNCELDFRSSG
jgi:hypothetical protein